MGLLAKITPLPLKIAGYVLLQCIKVKAVGMRVCERCDAFHISRKGCVKRDILTSDTASSSEGEWMYTQSSELYCRRPMTLEGWWLPKGYNLSFYYLGIFRQKGRKKK
jgi:hypothetical protein